MNCRKRLPSVRLIAALCLLAVPALAQVTPVIFERGDIRIDPVAAVALKPGEQPVPRASSTYNVEVRSEDALKLEYIHTLNTLTDSTGVLIMFEAPSIVSLPRMQVYTPVDALFIGQNGAIVQIYPNVTLAALQQDIYTREPVKAFLFLKAGTVAVRRILPKDVIAGSMFTPAPPTLQ